MIQWSEEKLDILLSIPSKKLIYDMLSLDGDIMVLGAGGKLGPSLCLLAKNAINSAKIDKKVIAVTKNYESKIKSLLDENNIETIDCDLANEKEFKKLPKVRNIIYMVGFKASSIEKDYIEEDTKIAKNVSSYFKESRIVVFSSGIVYPLVSLDYKSKETDSLSPIETNFKIREKIFIEESTKNNTELSIIRLSNVIDLRTGVLFDIAKDIKDRKELSLEKPCFSCVWQGNANEAALRALLHAKVNANIINVTGTDIISIEEVANTFGILLKEKPLYKDNKGSKAYLSDPSKCISLFGMPSLTIQEMIKWQAEWIINMNE